MSRADTPTGDWPIADIRDAESELVSSLRAGDDDAYERLVRTQAPRLLAVARRILGNEDEAADALQEAFLSAFRAIDSFDGNSKLSTWLHRIVVNAALMRLRKKRRRPETALDDLLPSFNDEGHRLSVQPAWNETAEDLVERRELRQRVLDRIHELPDDYRDVILLRDIEQLDTQQTAEMIGISTGAVKTRLHRARLALRSLLEQELSEFR